MTNKIIDGIIRKLTEAFGDDYEIYPEELKQGLQKPCFFIKLLNPTNTKERGERYYRENSFCIHFFPQSTNEPKSECYEILDELYLALEYIEVEENLVRGVSVSSEMHDGILLFFINYNVFVSKVYDPAKMEILETIQMKKTKG